MFKYINLTPHTINIHRDDLPVLVVPPSGNIARVGQTTTHYLSVDGIDFLRRRMGAVEGLPEPRENTYFITSAQVADAVNRPDVVSPGPLIRNDEGQPIGCQGVYAYGFDR